MDNSVMIFQMRDAIPSSFYGHPETELGRISVESGWVSVTSWRGRGDLFCLRYLREIHQYLLSRWLETH